MHKHSERHRLAEPGPPPQQEAATQLAAWCRSEAARTAIQAGAQLGAHAIDIEGLLRPPTIQPPTPLLSDEELEAFSFMIRLLARCAGID